MCSKFSPQTGKAGKLILMLIFLLTLNFILLSSQTYAGGDAENPEKLAGVNGLTSSSNIAISAYRLIVGCLSDSFFYLRIKLMEKMDFKQVSSITERTLAPKVTFQS